MRVATTKVYLDWINSLNDRAGRARIQVRVDRLVHGNPGQHRALTDGVCELKIDFGPGYRVYYTERAGVVVVLTGWRRQVIPAEGHQDRDLVGKGTLGAFL